MMCASAASSGEGCNPTRPYLRVGTGNTGNVFAIMFKTVGRCHAVMLYNRDHMGDYCNRRLRSEKGTEKWAESG